MTVQASVAGGPVPETSEEHDNWTTANAVATTAPSRRVRFGLVLVCMEQTGESRLDCHHDILQSNGSSSASASPTATTTPSS